MKIIGIAGTNGSGKDTVGQILSETYNYLFVPFTDMLRDEARRRGKPVEREVLRTISSEWRKDGGLGVLVDKSLDVLKSSVKEYDGIAVASLRNPGEADRIHELGGQVIWVDADAKIRFDRIYTRQRTAEDDKTFEQFLAEEQAEMQHSGDETTLNMSGVKDKADIFLTNEGSKEEFAAKLKTSLHL